MQQLQQQAQQGLGAVKAEPGAPAGIKKEGAQPVVAIQPQQLQALLALQLQQRAAAAAVAQGQGATQQVKQEVKHEAKADAGDDQETDQWVQCSKCQVWRQVPDEFWPEFENADEDEDWYCKVVATLGPACADVDTLSALLEAGMTVARVDLTWGPLEYHKRSLTNLNAAMKRVRRMCAVMVDTLGREMLIKRRFTLGPDGWPQHESPIKVSAGTSITITIRDDVEATPTLLPITYAKFPSLVQPGDIVYIGRYLACGAPEQASLYLKVHQVHAESGDVVCVALNDAELHGLLTVFNLERSASELISLQSDLPVLTEYDKQALRELAAEGYEIDFVAISYCRSGADVREVRTFAEGVEGLRSAALVAKVETRQALFNFRGILEAADGITVSRGLLGLDCVPEKVALIQKSLISACNLVGKPVIITRVLDSMTDSPRPTRAEATDVANAVLDGADALFLGAETLRGKYPVATVRTLVSIARQAERVFDFRHHFEWLMQAAMDAQEVRDALSSGYGGPAWGGGGLDDDDAATDIFMLTGGMGGMGMTGGPMGHHFGSVGAGLAGFGAGGGHAGAGYGDVGGMTPLASMGPPGGVGGVGGATGLSPASSNLEELVAADGGVIDGPAAATTPGGGATGGAGGPAGHHVSFAGLPPRPPGRTRSNASMPDIGGGGGGTTGGGTIGGGSLSAAGGSPLQGPPGSSGVGSTIAPSAQSGGSRSQSYADINTAVAAMARFGTGPRDGHAQPGHHNGGGGGGHGHSQGPGHGHHGPASGRASPSVRSTTGTLYGGGPSGPYMGKLESIASSAVRAAEKVKASLIVVYTHTSRVASLVAKYRPPMPILTLVVPRLTSDGLKWTLQGRGHARQCLIMRGLLPMLSAPGPSGDEVLEEAIAMSSRLGLVGPGHHMVVVERVHDAFCLKIVAVDELGLGIQRDGPLDPARAVVRALVPATPVVGRTLSMMNDNRLPSAAALVAAAARNSVGNGVGGINNALGVFGGGGGGSDRDVNFGGGGGGFTSYANPVAMGPMMGVINSLLAASPSIIGTGAPLTADSAALAGSGGLAVGGGPRRMTSSELINTVPRSPVSSSPFGGAGLVANTTGGGGASGTANNARMGLLNALMGAASPPKSGGGDAGAGGAVAPGLIHSVAGGGSPAGISLPAMPVLNALGGGLAARDSPLASVIAAAAAGDGGVIPSRGSPLEVVAEEPEGMSPFHSASGDGNGGNAEGAGGAGLGGPAADSGAWATGVVRRLAA
ncbi:hypothetical protein GPECTOR_1g78 [Gonium pectorale]|uniref:Pyruvate kinase n=1 Tax=Gonium pectorale TaxID=33097 RepID=A0A150H478_GONPE|nr:hypothetical protein GPECTOR_1g78 [Gonium pectorale]|eukprot:KXZ56864.1 hypothetical protein GPECTOR_1g78 [Gonium pectorale]